MSNVRWQLATTLVARNKRWGFGVPTPSGMGTARSVNPAVFTATKARSTSLSPREHRCVWSLVESRAPRGQGHHRGRTRRQRRPNPDLTLGSLSFDAWVARIIGGTGRRGGGTRSERREHVESEDDEHSPTGPRAPQKERRADDDRRELPRHGEPHAAGQRTGQSEERERNAEPRQPGPDVALAPVLKPEGLEVAHVRPGFEKNTSFVFRSLFVSALIGCCACSPPPLPTDCTAGLVCPVGQACNSVSRRCEFMVTPNTGGSGAGTVTAGGAGGGSTTTVSPWSMAIDVSALNRALPPVATSTTSCRAPFRPGRSR
jgi:hypothetical protein